MHRVDYDPDSQEKAIRKAIELTIKTCESTDDLGASEVPDLFINYFPNLLPSFKHPAFSEEHEWRAVNAAELEEIDFDVVNGRLKPFIKLWTGSKDDPSHLPISKVIVGTEGLTELSIYSAEMLLAKCGYNAVKVEASRVPIREI